MWEQPPQRRQNLKSLDVEITPIKDGDRCQPFDVTQIRGSEAESAERQAAWGCWEGEQVDFAFDDEDAGVVNGKSGELMQRNTPSSTRQAIRFSIRLAE